MPTKVYASGFAAVPYGLLDKAPDSFVVHVFAVLHRHGWNSASGAWVSLHTLRQETGITIACIRRSLRWLEENGWVEAVVRPGKTTVFHVRIEPTQTGNHRARKRVRSKTTEQENDSATQIENDLRTRTHEQEPSSFSSCSLESSYEEKERVRKTSTKTAGKAKPDPLRLRALPLEAVPLDLLSCADLLMEFWAVKKGVRSTPVFNRVCRKLLDWTASERQEALERAISSGWGDVFQPQPKAPSRGSWAPPEMKHPAARDFTAERIARERAEQERIEAIPSATGGRGVLESLF